MFMFDVETLGVDSNSVVLSAGLVHFEPGKNQSYQDLLDNACYVKFKAKEQIDFAFPLYHNIQSKLNVVFDFELPILRKLFSVEEQNNWFHAADKPNLAPFLDAKLVTSSYSSIDSPFHYGKVNHTGYLEISILIETYTNFLKSINCFSDDTFNYDEIEFLEGGIKYKNIKAKHIIFAEGFGLHANPYFNDLPLDGTKGELLIIKAPYLKLDVVIKSSVFILPIGNDLYKVGATYDWIDKTNTPTQAGKDELIEKLSELISCDFEIVKHFAGVRPTVKDRRPLVGTHPIHSQLHVLNGLGTRGVMLGPYRDWETDRKSTRLNSSHLKLSRMPSSA